MVIDFGLLFLLVHMHVHLWIAQPISFAAAASNGYYWNSKWTFQGLGSGARHHQYIRFLVFSAIGLGINMAIVSFGLNFLTGGRPDLFTKPQLAKAKLVAVVIVAFWNFLSNKLWNFKGEAPTEV